MNHIRSRTKDPFLLKYNPSELETAAEFLTNWLPFITKDLCRRCTLTISNRIRSLEQQGSSGNVDVEPSQSEECLSSTTHTDMQEDSHDSNDNCDCDTHSLGSWKDGANGWSEPVVVDVRMTETATTSEWKSVDPPGARLSWADMADELEEEEGLQQGAIRPPLNGACDSTEVGKQVQKKELTRGQREYIRFMNVQRKKDFICMERVRGKMVNVLEGLELHCGVFSAAEQKRIVDLVLDLKEKGKDGDLKARTYTAPEPWMRGKGRVTIQFGCCYNYATDKKGNPPGILRSELVDPIPHLFKVIIRRMVRWHVLPPSCVPDSCIVNIYEEGNCIPPHIDSHDFVRPFCTVSFLSECNIVFGSTLKILGPGDFSGSTVIPLPVGSVLVLQGNGADVAKHCVPAVQSKRISITFRKMDESKRPTEFIPEADLQGIQPLAYDMDESNTSNPSYSPPLVNRQPSDTDELKITYPANSPPRVNRRPVSRENNSERRRGGFPGRGSGRGSGSEPRHSATPNRQPSDTDESKIPYPLNSSPQVNRQPFIRESSSERRKEFFLGRGSESEPRYSTPPNHANQQPVIRDRLPDSGKGILGRGGQSEPPRYSNTRQSQQSNRPRVRMSLGT